MCQGAATSRWSALSLPSVASCIIASLVHANNRRACAITLTLFAAGVALSALLIAAYSRPFTGEISVTPELLKQVISTEAKGDTKR
jgi:membrane protease YdiL (CAAX protease family)